MAVGRPGAMRRDALRNRQAIVRAAAELLLVEIAVPTSEIARRAGVGQATLYRHFPDRASLAMAICEENLRGLERLATAKAGDPDRFESLLQAVVNSQLANRTLVALLRGGPDGARNLHRLTRRVAGLFAGPMREAQRAGQVRADLTPADMMLVLMMIEGLLRDISDPTQRRAAAGRATELLRSGLIARP
jgi:AcrR family transcriptional regulator